MALPLTINGQVFEYPQNFDEEWGVAATGWAQAVTAGALYLSGGSFPLTNTVDFGSSFGMKVKSITSKTTNPASAGYLLLAKTDAIEWRNNANSANLSLGIDGSDNLTFNGATLGTTSLTNAHIFVGNVSNVPTDVAMSGDATIANTGALTIANSAITNAKVSAAAAIALTKLATMTASRAVVSDAGGLLVPSAVTSTELGYSSGLSGNIQTQIGTLLPLSGGTMSGVINMASHKITSLASGTSISDAVAFGQVQGTRILQQVQATGTTSTSTASAAFVNTVITATITPASTSSKIKVTTGSQLNVPASGVADVTITRTGLGTISGSGLVRNNGGPVVDVPFTITYLDSPATASAITYTVQLRVAGGGTAAINAQNAVWTMLLEEIG